MKFKWSYLIPLVVVGFVLFVFSMVLDQLYSTTSTNHKPISFQAPQVQEYGIKHEEEPLPPIKYFGYLKSSKVNDLNHLYFEVFDQDKHLYKIVQLYGIKVPNDSNIKKAIDTVIGVYAENQVIIVSRTDHPDQQFDIVSIKIITPNNILIDLAELLTTKGSVDVTEDTKHQMTHALLNKGKSYAQEHHLGIWANTSISK